MSIFGKIAYGLQVTAIGLVVVFLGLGILIGFIMLMAQVFKIFDAKKAEKARAEEAARLKGAEIAAQPQAAPAAQAVPAVAPQAEDVTDDAELIAVIAAAIAAFTDSDRQLVVRRVRRVPGWGRAARSEQVCRF